MPINYKEYAPNWKLISRFIRYYRAKNCCEWCGVRNYSVVRNEKGKLIPLSGNIILDMYGQGLQYPSLEPVTYKQAKQVADFQTDNDEMGARYYPVVLTVAHIDHDKNNNSFFNLAALCQKCHLNHDKHQHAKSRRQKQGQLQIF